MDLLLIVGCLLMAALFTLAGMMGNRTLAQRAAPAESAGAGIPPVQTSLDAGPVGTAATGQR